jgi:hypothetical protein
MREFLWQWFFTMMIFGPGIALVLFIRARQPPDHEVQDDDYPDGEGPI